MKLLDFGVAKLVETDAPADRTELTRLTGRIFTPEYAAPEQILGEPITTATDVYSLGVLLHVLLTGTRPYGGSNNPVEIERAVLHDEPVRASRAVAMMRSPLLRRAPPHPRGSARSLAGDLDNIIARALRKAPAERYPSVLALADDVRRHLEHQPILARPESLATRTRKFVRRHRVGVVAAMIVALALGAGVAGIVWQSQVARNEARKATAIKDFPGRRVRAQQRRPPRRREGAANHGGAIAGAIGSGDPHRPQGCSGGSCGTARRDGHGSIP